MRPLLPRRLHRRLAPVAIDVPTVPVANTHANLRVYLHLNADNLQPFRKSKVTIAVVTIFFVLHLFLKHFRRRQPSLPTLLTFNPMNSTTSPLYCAVCLHDVAGGETHRKLPKCGHCFHADCIDDWLRSKLTCPLCRSQVCHLPPQHQRPRQRRILTHIVALCLTMLGRNDDPRSYELILAFCDNMVFVSH
ncbi:hypothetical protein RJ640_016726, partial [Escallonia rubra]